MEFRTVVNIEPSSTRITYDNKVLFIGSCFAAEMGAQMRLRKMPVIINPFGTIYNPASVKSTLEAIISGKVFDKNSLYHYNGTWLSFSHYTDFSSDDPVSLLKRMNKNRAEAEKFLKSASFIFITFGTARFYRLKETGEIVSNCHKVPASYFTAGLMGVDEIVKSWKGLMDVLSEFNPKLNVVFTVSPVRHWKDGAHGNQISKSVLFLAIEELMKSGFPAKYFPAYELLMDDLRDYRYYADDMLHPSPAAIEYIWEKFSETYFDRQTVELQSSVIKIVKATEHLFMTDSSQKKREFSEKMLKQISEIERKNSNVDLKEEEKYFFRLLKH